MQVAKDNRSPHAMSDAERAYIKKLAEVYVKLSQMTPEQRQKYADKEKELGVRLKKLPPAAREAYEDEVRALLDEGRRPVVPAQEEDVRDEERDNDAYDEEDESDEDAQPRKKKGKGCVGCLVVLLVLLLAAAAAAGAAWMWVKAEIDGDRGGEVTESTFIVERGSGTSTIGNQLADNGIIRNAIIFRFYVRQTEQDGTLQYGEFTFRSDMSYDEIIEVLQETNKERDDIVTVTFPEGIPAVEFANRMEEAGLCTAEEFLEVANNDDFSEHGFWNRRDENENQFMKCEGYLFPDTYQFFKDDSVHNMVGKLYGEFDSKMTEEMYAQIGEMGFTLTEFMTLASIVQEEAGGVEHQADVAAIFMNRLADDSPVRILQSNCSSYIQNENDNNYIYNTIAWYYGSWENIPQEIIDAYDTYNTEGLPAGPISNPGLDAITNTLRYAESEYYGNGYYFFVTDINGNYYFNQTASAHQAQVDELKANGTYPG